MIVDIHRRIGSFLTLGEHLRNAGQVPGAGLPGAEILAEASARATAANAWFTPDLVTTALRNLGEALNPGSLAQWLAPYLDRLAPSGRPQQVGVVMAGNLPAVGFHDFLSVLMAGHRLTARLSAGDRFLIPAMAEVLIATDPAWTDAIAFTEGRLEMFDAVIATGSDNTSRYFEYYFGRYPHIIRKNRHGLALISGGESQEELDGLAGDILLYFGLGCRNVSKIVVPSGYDFTLLTSALTKYHELAQHHKYRNNLDYQRSVLLLNGIPYTDTGVILLKEDPAIASPVGVLHYVYEDDTASLTAMVRECSDAIQCVVSSLERPFPTIRPGRSQRPELWEYADGVDTLDFLLALGK